MSDEHGTRRLREAIEATRLGFGLSRAEVEELVDRAGAYGVRGVCVPVTLIATAAVRAAEKGYALEQVTVANFPTGDHPASAVRREVVEAIVSGATEIDLVVPGGAVAEGAWNELTRFVREVRHTAEERAGRAIPIKVIVETAAWDRDEIIGAAEAAIEAGARWLKTSTGFHPGGGATVEAVSLLRSIAPAGVGVKASGGIRDRAAALAMLDAGADRIGTSAEIAIFGPIVP